MELEKWEEFRGKTYEEPKANSRNLAAAANPATFERKIFIRYQCLAKEIIRCYLNNQTDLEPASSCLILATTGFGRDI
jgi:hypothetical protein